jgi:hypothetical protein
MAAAVVQADRMRDTLAPDAMLPAPQAAAMPRPRAGDPTDTQPMALH